MAELRAGRHDPALRRKAQRKGREAGCWVYLPLEALDRAGMASPERTPYYRVWAGPRGSVVIRLYSEP